MNDRVLIMPVAQGYDSDKYDYRVSYDWLSEPRLYRSTLVYQLGRIHCKRGTVIPVHTQLNYIELTIATDGKATVYTDGVGVEIEAGDIYVSFPGDFHAITSDTRSPLKYDFLSFYTEDKWLWGEMENIIAEHHDARERIIRDRAILKLVAEAINEAADGDEYSDTVMSGLFERISVGIIRSFRTSNRERKASEVGDEELLCLKLMNYIDNHIYSITNLKELEGVTNYTYNYTSNTFKRVTGDTLANYYRNRRFETAALLLKSGRFTIGQVASMLNYSSIYSFSLAFKKRFGYAPTAVKGEST